MEYFDQRNIYDFDANSYVYLCFIFLWKFPEKTNWLLNRKHILMSFHWGILPLYQQKNVFYFSVGWENFCNFIIISVSVRNIIFRQKYLNLQRTLIWMTNMSLMSNIITRKLSTTTMGIHILSIFHASLH